MRGAFDVHNDVVVHFSLLLSLTSSTLSIGDRSSHLSRFESRCAFILSKARFIVVACRCLSAQCAVVGQSLAAGPFLAEAGRRDSTKRRRRPSHYLKIHQKVDS